MRKKIGIIGAMNVETELILEKAEVIEKIKYAGISYHVCKYKDLDLIVSTCGIGKVNAASCTQVMIDKFAPDAIINTGVAGGMHSDVKVCDVVISNEVTYYDVRKEQMKTCFPYKESFIPCNTLKTAIITAVEKLEASEIDYHVGKIASGDSFVTEKAQKDKIIKDYEPLCVDMESCPIAHIADINEVPFVIIRSISDNADEHATMSYEQFESIAAYNSAQILLHALDGMCS